jgi:hypothetical protein
LALAAGAALGLSLRPHNQADPAGSTAPISSPEASALAAFSAVTEREKFLVRQFDDYTNPGEGKRLAFGVAACLELSEFYLEHHELDKAEHYFKRLIDDPHKIKPYVAIGTLGQAIVLSARGEAKRSNQLFLEGQKGLEGTKFFDLVLRFESPLRPYVARALERNAATEPIPEELAFLRQPPAPFKPLRRSAGKGLGN